MNHAALQSKTPQAQTRNRAQSRAPADKSLTGLQEAADQSSTTTHLASLQRRADQGIAAENPPTTPLHDAAPVAQLSGSGSDSSSYSSTDDTGVSSSSGTGSATSGSSSGSGSVSAFNDKQADRAYDYAQSGKKMRKGKRLKDRAWPEKLGGPSAYDREKAYRYAPRLRKNQKALEELDPIYRRRRKRAGRRIKAANFADGTAKGIGAVNNATGRVTWPVSALAKAGVKVAGGKARKAAAKERRKGSRSLRKLKGKENAKRAPRALADVEKYQAIWENAEGNATITNLPGQDLSHVGVTRNAIARLRLRRKDVSRMRLYGLKGHRPNQAAGQGLTLRSLLIQGLCHIPTTDSAATGHLRIRLTVSRT